MAREVRAGMEREVKRMVTAQVDWYSLYKEDDGSTNYRPIALWIEYVDGDFDSVSPDHQGHMEPDSGMDNFLGIRYLPGHSAPVEYAVREEEEEGDG